MQVAQGSSPLIGLTAFFYESGQLVASEFRPLHGREHVACTCDGQANVSIPQIESGSALRDDTHGK